MLQCCDHPYLVDQSLQSSLTKGHPLTDILDIGVQSSGKLLLLDKMLQELKTEGLRVLILCQVRCSSNIFLFVLFYFDMV
jgi:SNF2 family DNA or RNA helicase